MQQLMPLCHTRIKTFADFMELCQFFFISNLPLTEELLTVSGKLTHDRAAFILQTMIWHMEEADNWGSEGLEKASHDIADLFSIHHKKILMPLLFATIMGNRFGPPLFASVQLLGKERTRARYLKAIEFLGGISNKKMARLTKAWEAKECSELC